VCRLAVVCATGELGRHELSGSNRHSPSKRRSSINYLWHERYTWRDRPAMTTRGTLLRLGRFNAVTAATSIVRQLILTAVSRRVVQSSGPSAPTYVKQTDTLAVIGYIHLGAPTIRLRCFRAPVAIGAVMLMASPTNASSSYRSDSAAKRAKRLREVCRHRRSATRQGDQPTTSRSSTSSAGRRRPGWRADDRGADNAAKWIVTRAAWAVTTSRTKSRSTAASINPTRRGTVFVPNVKLDAMLKVLQETANRQAQAGRRAVVARGVARRRFAEGVPAAAAHEVRDRGLRHRVRRRLQALAPIARAATASRRKSWRIENAGTPRERALPEGNDHGYMWKLNSVLALQQLDDGVLVEIESLTLSREPAEHYRAADPADRDQHRPGIDDADARLGAALAFRFRLPARLSD
jgi:hypothetical protein